MTITEVRVRKIDSGKLLAVASVTIDKAFVVHDFKIFSGSNGIFVSMPSVKTPEGVYRDTAHPVTKEARDQFSNTILEAYRSAV